MVATALLLASCGGSSASPDRPAPVPGATIVYGSERLAWNQDGNTSSLQFLAYVDDSPVALDASCATTPLPAQCSAPLPPLTTGVHRIAVAAVAAESAVSGLESERSESITVQKVTARSVVSALSFPDAGIPSSAPGLESLVTAADGRAFAVDVVARGLRAPVQLAVAADGRVLVAEANGHVRVIRPDEPGREAAALDAHALLDPPLMGPLGVALHPDFARNHFVYLAFLAEEQPAGARLRIVRLRETADLLGEPATLFEAPVTAAFQDPSVPILGAAHGSPDSLSAGAPRLAFGPDRLLYVLLPPETEFDREPSASRPLASMLRLADDGRAPDVGPLSGINVHPLGFGWHPATSDLWVIAPSGNGSAVLRPVTSGPLPAMDAGGLAVLRLTDAGGAAASPALAFEPTETTSALAAAFSADLDPASFTVVRLATPVLIETVLSGISGRIGDAVAARDGTLFLATSNSVGADPDAGGDIVVRLRARPSP
ncbi:MAG TPA: PQQ-dependent sugar dehydrogenase [Vicinamibacterales bacterium]|nr:PQQ-dependent sugar dehydrogenase [Vicinamibacterales bacterium]